MKAMLLTLLLLVPTALDAPAAPPGAPVPPLPDAAPVEPVVSDSELSPQAAQRNSVLSPIVQARVALIRRVTCLDACMRSPRRTSIARSRSPPPHLRLFLAS